MIKKNGKSYLFDRLNDHLKYFGNGGEMLTKGAVPTSPTKFHILFGHFKERNRYGRF